jgi:RNA 2',3'-cyclic 3'-phosphodiesterase
MPRLFIALEFPEPVKDRLSEVCGNLPGADWVYSDQFHLTLRFLGEQDPEIFSRVREALHGLQARSFTITLKGMGVFPLRGEPEILWAGVARSEGLIRLRHKLESLLARNGVPPDARKFFPHVTLAKVGASRESWVGQYVADHSLFSIPEIPMQGFSLFSSRLRPEGSIHTVEETYPLEGILEAE